MRNTPSLLALAIMAVSLSGCQLFAPRHGNSVRNAQATPDMSSYFDQRLADGRRHLRAGRLGSAITAYRQASYSAEHAARSYNGMAIAYDLLGRADIAQGYFNAALALEPDNPQVARNLARFEDRNPNIGADDEVQLAIAGEEDFSAIAADQEELRAAAAVSAAALVPEGRLVRVGNRELRIRGREDWASRVDADETERAAVVRVGRQDRTRMAVTTYAENYPVRVRLDQIEEEPGLRRPVRRGPPNGSSYPIRLSIPRG